MHRVHQNGRITSRFFWKSRTRYGGGLLCSFRADGIACASCMRNAAVDRIGTVRTQAPRTPARAACVVSSGGPLSGCVYRTIVTPSEHAAVETAITDASSRKSMMWVDRVLWSLWPPRSAMRYTVARVVGPITIIPPSDPASKDDNRDGSYPSYLAALSTACPTSRLSEPSRVQISKAQAEKSRIRITSSAAGRNKRAKPKVMNQMRTARSLFGSEDGMDDSGGAEVDGREGVEWTQRRNRRKNTNITKRCCT